MKHSIIKKITAVVLCLAILFVLPATAAAKATAYPVVYLSGIEDSVLYANPNKYTCETLFDMDSQAFLSAATKIFSGFYLSKEEGIGDAMVAQVNEGIDDILGPIACNKNGNSKDSAIGAWNFPLPVGSSPSDSEIMTDNVKAISTQAKGSVGYDRFYVFTYDWRLDPCVSAEKLAEYIENVLKKTRADKVSLIAEGYGGVVVNAYLYKFPTNAAQRVHSCVFLDCPLMGNAIMGDLMKGKIAKTSSDTDDFFGTVANISGAERGTALVDYMKDDPNGWLSSLVGVFLGKTAGSTLIGQLAKLLAMKIVDGTGSLDEIGKSYNNFALLAAKNVYAAGLREYLRNMPGLWALIPEEDYNEALTFLFPGNEAPTSTLMTKIGHARKVTESTENTFKKARKNGIRMYVVANYGTQMLPATVSFHDESDGVESTKYASVGAITLECTESWKLHNNCANFYHDHLSPDKDINANNCALPENTWFIKDLPSRQFSGKSAADFVVWMATSADQRNVWENGDYTQYLSYSKYSDALSAYTGDMSAQHYVLGDTNSDGKISAADARQALRYAVGLETPNQIMQVVADVDGDGQIAAADARLLLRYSVGIISNFPAEAL